MIGPDSEFDCLVQYPSFSEGNQQGFPQKNDIFAGFLNVSGCSSDWEEGMNLPVMEKLEQTHRGLKGHCMFRGQWKQNGLLGSNIDILCAILNSLDFIVFSGEPTVTSK